MSAFLLPATCRSTASVLVIAATSRTLPAVAAASTSFQRPFSTTPLVQKKSHRARGAARKSPRNQAILDSLSTRFGAAAVESKTKSKKAPSPLEPKEGETLLTLDQACEQLQAKDAQKRPNNAFELHIVTTVSTHQSNALRGRISFPRDPRTKQERLLIFAEEGSEVNDRVKQILAEERARIETAAPAARAALGTAAGSAATKGAEPAEGSAAAASSTSAAATDAAYEPSIIVGGSDLISSVLHNRVQGYTKVLCTSSLLPEVSRSLARSLGPKGLMPNPRRGTVVPADDGDRILAAIREARGATDWRSDKIGVVRGAVGRLHFAADEVRKNVTTLLDAIVEKVPTLGSQSAAGQTAGGSAKVFVERAPRTPGELKRAAGMIKQVHLSSTQGPAYKLDLRDVLL